MTQHFGWRPGARLTFHKRRSAANRTIAALTSGWRDDVAICRLGRNHPSHKKYASNAALKAQRPVKSLTRILIDLKTARITPVKNQSATMASAIFQSIGKCPRPLPHGPPQKPYCDSNPPYNLALIQPALFRSDGPRHVVRGCVGLFVFTRKQDRSNDNAGYKHRDEGQASEAWRSWINSPELLVQESLVATIYL